MGKERQKWVIKQKQQENEDIYEEEIPSKTQETLLGIKIMQKLEGIFKKRSQSSEEEGTFFYFGPRKSTGK